jgi:hypothetical protein
MKTLCSKLERSICDKVDAHEVEYNFEIFACAFLFSKFVI